MCITASLPKYSSLLKRPIEQPPSKPLQKGKVLLGEATQSPCTRARQSASPSVHLVFRSLLFVGTWILRVYSLKIRIFKPLLLPCKLRWPFLPHPAFPSTWEKFSLNTPGDCQPQMFKFQNQGICFKIIRWKRKWRCVFVYLAICLGLLRSE